MQYMKLSTSRDFRINAATLEAALQEQQQDESQQVCLCLNIFILRQNPGIGFLIFSDVFLSSDWRFSAFRGKSSTKEKEEEAVKTKASSPPFYHFFHPHSLISTENTTLFSSSH